jgi:ABC-type nickel/cobalt efflux system permease component RcnA
MHFSALQVGVKMIIIFSIGMVVMVLVYAVLYQICKNYKKNKQGSEHFDNKDIED